MKKITRTIFLSTDSAFRTGSVNGYQGCLGLFPHLSPCGRALNPLGKSMPAAKGRGEGSEGGGVRGWGRGGGAPFKGEMS